MTSHSSEIRSRFIAGSVTPVGINPPEWRLSGRGMFFMGSCFAEYLYGEYSRRGLNACTAPFGNIYNPESIAAAAQMLADPKKKIAESDCFSIPGNSDDFRHFMFHSRKSASTAGALAERLNSEIEKCREYIAEAEAAVLTLGTSIVYRLKSGETVNNCHKLKPALFERVQLDVPGAADALSRAAEALRTINPAIRLTVTLSPVRHIRDDASENSLSKAVLRCAIEEVCGSAAGQDNQIWYFPSYEIMLDELRDYRWFADDLCHPSTAAVSYIMERFRDAAYSDQYKVFLSELLKITRDLEHRPGKPESEEYRRFREKAVSRLEELGKKYPGVLA